MNESTAVLAASWKSCSAIGGRIVRSMPTIAPTNAFTTTRSVNCARFARMPRRTATGLMVKLSAKTWSSRCLPFGSSLVERENGLHLRKLRGNVAEGGNEVVLRIREQRIVALFEGDR